MKKVYLAGAMDRVPPEFAVTWRKAATKALQEAGFFVYNPCDGKNMFDPNIQNIYEPREIVIPDLAMVSDSDIIFAEVSRNDVPYHGTSMEIYEASNAGKAVYVWGGCRSPWIRFHATWVFDYFDDALAHILVVEG